jgi:hypothetical protein
MVLGKIFRPKAEEATSCWRNLHSEELHNLHYSPGIISVNETTGRNGQSRELLWEGFKINTAFQLEMLKGDHLGDEDVDGRIILK